MIWTEKSKTINNHKCNEDLEEVQKYNYWKQMIKLEKVHKIKVKQYIPIGWKNFSKNRDIMKGSLKHEVYNECLLWHTSGKYEN